MRALNDCIKEDKSKADEMFEKLGYRKVMENKKAILYVKGMLELTFYKNDKTIGINTDTGERVFDTTIYGCTEISVNELQAINEKCKELGWLDKER